MQIDRIVVGKMTNNCYILYDGNEGMIIDPGFDSEKIISRVDELKINIKYIVLTHGHFDHILGLPDIKNKYKNALVVIHKKEEQFLKDSRLNLVWYANMDFPPIDADLLIEDGDILTINNKEIKVIWTPGHSIGSVCLLVDNILITGDTLFNKSIGRCDHPTGNLPQEVNSVINILFKLDEKLVVYPGHGLSTTIGYEKSNNEVYEYLDYK